MNKQELIYKIEKLPYNLGPIVDTMKINRAGLIKLIEQLDEPKKPVVPKFVADYIEKYKEELSVREAMSKSYATFEVDKWLAELDEDGNFINQNTFAIAWIFGYEVEKEKRYSVKIKGEIEENLLVYGLGINRYFFARTYDSSKRNEHTRKELEEASFGWVFDCPGIEIEEVEE